MIDQRKSRAMLPTVGRLFPALLLSVLAVADMMTFTSTRPWGAAAGIAELFALDDLGWGRVGIAITVLLLLLLARALARGKRQAWMLSVGLVVFSFLAALSERTSRTPLLVLLGALVALLALAPLFGARSDPHTLRRGYVALAMGIVALIGRSTVHALIHGGEAGVLVLEPHALLFVLRSAAYLPLCYGVIEVLRPVLRGRTVPATERARASVVVQLYGQISLAHYALGPNLSYFWSESGRSLLAYRPSHGIALVLGDPIGPADEFAALLQAFRAFCRKQDWSPAIYQASPQTLHLLKGEEVHAVKVGEEAIVDLARFTTRGKTGAPVRHAIARAKRGGISTYYSQGCALPEYMFAGMKRVTSAWLRAHHTHSQMGFSMGRFPADWSPDTLTGVALGPEGDVQAYVTWTPLYGGDGWTLDNMRRSQETVPGTMEYLIAGAMEWAQERRFRHMSLSLAPLAGLNDDLVDLKRSPTSGRGRVSTSARLLERSAAYLHRHGLLLGNYRSLYFFKQKFQPSWEPRFLVVEEISALPRVLVALAAVHGMTWRSLLHETLLALRGSTGGEESDATRRSKRTT